MSFDSLDEGMAALELLGIHECWDPYFRLAKKLLSNPPFKTQRLFTQIARSQNLSLEDIFGATDTCISAVRELGLTYLKFTEEILSQILESEDFASEATILSGVATVFRDHSDHIQALERLCLLYEKKLHNDRLLAETYDKLLATDGGNLKALRYFKLVFTQNNEWEEVCRILKALLQNVSYPQEIYRVAQELAAVWLYQLNEPREALQVLETFCSDSPLDTSNILYDAYESLGDLNGCLKILRECLLNASDDTGRAKLLFKIAALEEQQGDQNSALQHYQKSFTLWPPLLDAAEGIISIAVEQKNWKLLEDTLNSLLENTQDIRLRGQIDQARRRLKNGVENALRA
jgi:hypothetical protein